MDGMVYLFILDMVVVVVVPGGTKGVVALGYGPRSTSLLGCLLYKEGVLS